MINKLKFGKESAFDTGGKVRGIYIGTVVAIGGNLAGVSKDETQSQSDQRFQSDSSIIRCEIKGKNFDDDVLVSELPNCLPMLPRHINVVPKVGEAVILFIMRGSLETEERLYLGPITSQPYNLPFEKKDETALAGFGFGTAEPDVNINTIDAAEGAYPPTHDISIQGRENSDLIFKKNEVLLRAGKFQYKQPKVYNKTNPSYIQIKNFHLYEPDSGDVDTKNIVGVTNIVSDKVNILSHKGLKYTPKDGTFNLADRDSMIDDDVLNEILEKAEPVVFGNKLVDYLNKLKAALVAHVHPQAETWTNRPGQTAIKDFVDFPLDTLLSKNIKIN
jgi:hypothetical protein